MLDTLSISADKETRVTSPSQWNYQQDQQAKGQEKKRSTDRALNEYRRVTARN
jgi:hypothetical protein